MNIGDKVRMMHSRDQGIITRFLSNDVVEVAIDNDFTIPVSRHEIVVIAPEEAQAFSNNYTPPRAATQAAPALIADKGLYLAYLHETPELLALQIVNHSDTVVLFTFGEKKKGQYKAIISGQLQPHSSAQLGHYHLSDFENWPLPAVQWLRFSKQATNQYAPKEYTMALKASGFYKAKKQVPLLNKPGYVYDLEKQAQPIDAAKLQDQLADSFTAPVTTIEPPAAEIDLHIENLEPEYETLSPAAILQLQLNAFETALDRAIGSGMHQIIFIHGSGNGVLRKELHKRLSQNKIIKYYEDARKEKFGYGATLVKLV